MSKFWQLPNKQPQVNVVMSKKASNPPPPEGAVRPPPPPPPPPRSGQKILITRTSILDHGASDRTFEVKVMAIADGYAMVRRPGRMPFVCRDSDLTELV